MLKFELNVAERKTLAKRIEELTGIHPYYTKAPLYSYDIGSYTIDRDGNLMVEPENADAELLTTLLNEGLIRGGESIESTDCQPEDTELTADERTFITGDGVGKPLGLLAETGGAKVGVTAAQKDAVTFDEIFKLYYALKAPYRKKAQFLCNEALVLQLMTIKDNNGNYIWKPGLEIGKPDTLLNRPLKTSAFMPEIKGGSKVMAFGDYSYYWVADRQNRTFRRLNELYARTDQVGFLTTQRVDGKLILPEAVQLLQMAPQG